MKEKKPEMALAAFHQAVDAGWRPMYITRQHPNHIVRRRGEKEIRVVWLSTTLGKDDIDPHNLNSLSNLITNFVTDGPRAVILLDGIEYLMINNDFARILHFLEYVNEQIALNRAALILPVDERALDAKELAYIERNTIVLHDSIFVLFIPRAAEVLEECRAVQVEVGLEGSAVDDSPLPFEDKVRNARRENVPFIVVVEGGEKTLRTLGVIRQDGRQVWMTIERLAEAVRRESETPPKEARVTVPGSSESITLRNLPALCGDHIRKLGEIYRSNLFAPDRARTFKSALNGTDECPACLARRNEQESKPRRMRAKVLVVGEPDLRGSSLLRGFVLDAFDDKYVHLLGASVSKKLMRAQVDNETISLDLALWDIRGQKASEMIKEAYFYGTSGILFVCDGSNPTSLLALAEWTEAIQKVTGRIPVTILVNKTRRRSGRGLEEPAVAEAAKPSEAAYYFFSSSHDDQVEEALKNLGTRIARERWHKRRPDA